MIMDDECKAIGKNLDRKTEVLGESLPQCFVHHKSHIT
jgi:hypothetical protein